MQLKDKARELIDGKNKAVTAARQFKAEVEKVSAALTEAEATTAAAQKVRTYPVHCANAGVRIHHLPACFCFFFRLKETTAAKEAATKEASACRAVKQAADSAASDAKATVVGLEAEAAALRAQLGAAKGGAAVRNRAPSQ